jgi:hypothetical protein
MGFGGQATALKLVSLNVLPSEFWRKFLTDSGRKCLLCLDIECGRVPKAVPRTSPGMIAWQAGQ